jgi:hypothetical protein
MGTDNWQRMDTNPNYELSNLNELYATVALRISTLYVKTETEPAFLFCFPGIGPCAKKVL